MRVTEIIHVPESPWSAGKILTNFLPLLSIFLSIVEQMDQLLDVEGALPPLPHQVFVHSRHDTSARNQTPIMNDYYQNLFRYTIGKYIKENCEYEYGIRTVDCDK